jgi:hypothetical protein
MQSDNSGKNVETIELLSSLATEKEQFWGQLADKYGVSNPIPPWKSSLDGMCDALDENNCVLPLLERRKEEDEDSESVYAEVPYPERQLLSLAHSFVSRGVMSESELAKKLNEVKRRLNMY